MAGLGTYRDSDIPAILADMGVYVQLGTLPLSNPTPTTPKGILDENDQAIASDNGKLGVIAGMRTLTVQASAFPSVKIDDPLVLTDPNDFTSRLQCWVSDRVKEGDAALSKWILRTVQ